LNVAFRLGQLSSGRSGFFEKFLRDHGRAQSVYSH
jgi:hypothetical protein